MRYYVSTLVLWWREIVLVILVVACAGAALQWWRGPAYEAVAHVTVIRAEPSTASGGLVVEAGHRSDTQTLVERFAAQRAAFAATMLGLVHQGGLAEQVQARLGGQLAGVPAAGLLGMVRADLVTFRDEIVSDLIRITASAGTAQDAADLATIWAEEYVERLNRLPQGPNSRLDAVQSAMASAAQASDASQQRLEAFVAENGLDALKRQLAANERAVDILWQLRNQAVAAHAGIRERQALVLAESDLMRRHLDHSLRQMRALKTLLANAGEAAVVSNGLAIQFAKLRAFALVGDAAPSLLPGTAATERSRAQIGEVSIDATLAIHADAAAQGADLDAFIAALEELSAAYRDASDQASVMLAESSDEAPKQTALAAHLDANPLASAIDELEAKSRTLTVAIEAAASTLAALTDERDAARSALRALQHELIDQRVRNASSLPQVQLASIAAVPAGPASRSPGAVAMVVGAATLPAVIVLVLVANLMGIKPLIASLVYFITRRGNG